VIAEVADVETVQSSFRLDGRVAVVTGGSRGLGLAAAQSLAAAGASIVVTSRSASSCDDAVERIRSAGGKAVAVSADVGDLDDHHRIIAAAVNTFGRLDVLVNNAGISQHVLVEDVDAATYDRVHAVNAKGPVFLAQAALPHLEANGVGSVINVLSVGVWNGGASMMLYRSSKSALLGATMVMAKEWGPKGVRVNALAPGTFLTDMVTENLDEQTMAIVRGMTPVGRIAAPEEIGATVVYLAADASSFVTGSVLRIDGGLVSI
jgi:NAD(P)-dependent dehydrogenase (short-subunit alcohol dehydrogenase family)